MTEIVVLMAIAGGLLLLLGLAFTLLYAKAYRRPEQGHAIVVSKPASVDVYFTGALVLPVVARFELIDIRSKSVRIERCGKDGLHCRDNVRIDIVAVFTLRVGKSATDILRVAQTIGCARAGDPAVVEELFHAKLVEGLRTVAKQHDFDEIVSDVCAFTDEVLQHIGADLQGYVLDDLAIERLGQTPLGALDPDDILDAEGIRRIVERTAHEKMQRSKLQLEQERVLRAHQAEIEETIIELERRRSDALASLRNATGRQLSDNELRERMDERVRDMVRPVVQQILDERLGGSSPTPHDGDPARG